jgi:O-antigen/teichoic acid export membrane protein
MTGTPPGVVSLGERAEGTEQLGSRAASGVLWLAVQKWVVRASGVVTLAVITRRVSPHELGVVAAAMTIIPLVYLLADLGFSTYLLQSEEVDPRSLSTAFWASAAAGLVLSAALLGTAPLLATGFHIPELAQVLRALVLAVVPTVLAGVPLALLRRSLAFRTIAVQGLVAALLAQVVAVALALTGAGVWALVAQLVLTQWIIGLLAWRSAGWAPSWQLSPRQFRAMAAFGVRVSGVDVVATLRGVAESWIVAVTLGTAALGLLTIAQRLVQVAQELTAASVVPVSTVLFAKVRDSAERLRGTYLKALGVAYAVVATVMIVIVVTAPLVIPLLFGSQWRASALPAQALAIAGIITLGAMLDHGLFYGLGRPGSWLSYAVVVDAATVATTAVAVRWGLGGVALGFVVVAVAATLARWVLVGRLLRLRPLAVAGPFVRVLVPTAGALIAGGLVLRTVSGVDRFLAVALVAGVAVVVQLVLLRLTAAPVLRNALSVLPLPLKYRDLIRPLLG